MKKHKQTAAERAAALISNNFAETAIDRWMDALPDNLPHDHPDSHKLRALVAFRDAYRESVRAASDALLLFSRQDLWEDMAREHETATAQANGRALLWDVKKRKKRKN